MKALIFGTLLMCGAMAVAQSQSPALPPYSTPPTFPQQKTPPRSTPDTRAPAHAPDVDSPQQPQETPQSRPPEVDKPGTQEQLPQSDEAAQADESGRSTLASRIEKDLASEPTLGTSDIHVAEENGKIVLSGTVSSLAQRDVAMRIAKSKAGEREIVDKIKVGS